MPPKHKMIIIGLTGSIGMGKSTTARQMARMGLPVYDADKAVHQLLENGGSAYSKVARLFPNAVGKKGINRKKLSSAVFGKPEELAKLEDILHPLVQKVERSFLRAARRHGAKAVVLEIPLLFETGADARCDVTLCVTAPKAIQKARVLKRRGMTTAKFKAIMKRQMPDQSKKAKADFIISTGDGIAATRRSLVTILEQIGI